MSRLSLSFLFFLTLNLLALRSTSIAQVATPIEECQLTDKCTLIFATPEQGKQALAVNDTFMQHVQGLERQLRLESRDPVSQEEYIAFLQAGTKEWTDQEREQVAKATAEVATAMSEYDLPFPTEIQLVRVTRKVESNAPHCRGPAIILPDKFFNNRMKTVLTHELFHVLSSHNPDLRDRLYAVIGFEKTNPIELPDSLLPRRLTNPDAPVHQHVIELTFEGEPTYVVPVTLTRFNRYRPGGLFANMDFQFLKVEKKGEEYVPSLEDGSPVLLSPQNSPDFMEKIGRNTGYVIHPEETMADNFWMLMLGRSDVPDPWVLDKLKNELLK